MKTTTHPAVTRYLHELERALRDVPGPRRREIIEEIREHIDEATSMTPAEADDLQIRTVLDQLGDPETIAEEARERLGITRPKAGTPEGIAIALLLVGGLVLPAVGWIIGIVLLWISRVWTVRDKLIGTLVVPGGLALPLFLTVFAVGAGSYCEAVTTPDGAVVETCATQPLQFDLWGVPLLVALVLAPIVTAIYLGRRAFAQ